MMPTTAPCSEQVYTAVIGANVKHNYKSDRSYGHENTLRTMLDALGVNVYLGASREAKPMLDFFRRLSQPQPVEKP